MNKPNLSKFFKSVKSNVSKRSPEILTGIGIVGMVTTTILAVKATPRALDLINDAAIEKVDNQVKSEKEPDEMSKKLTTIDIIKAAWKPYIPAAITGTVSIACLIGASSVNARRNAALYSAYKLSETALSDYKDQVIETMGEKKEKEIREKIAQKKVDDQPVAKSEVIVTGTGNVLFLEPVSQRYFTSDIETVRKIINDLNYRLTTGMEEYISLSEFYDEIGLSHTAISDDIGWNINRDGQIAIDMPATKTDKGEPCLMLDYHVEPRYDYSNLM